MLPRRFGDVLTTQASPTVQLEKGSYRRVRSPLGARAGPLDFSSRRSPATTRTTHRNTHPSCRLTALLLALIFASFVSFGIAYYLFRTRWSASERPHGFSTNHRHPQVTVSPFPSGLLPDERFLAYLPHSGYHNQRIAFENALTLAVILNRSLIIPPARLGPHPIRYYAYNTLSKAIALSGKDGLHHCAYASSISSPECVEYNKYTLLPWNWLVNLASLSSTPRVVHRWDMTPKWVQLHLGLLPEDIFVLKDEKPYQYRFIDVFEDPAPPNPRFETLYQITELARNEHRLIQLGTLFGTSRLRLVQPANQDIRSTIRRAMVFNPPELHAVASAILSSLPSVFLGAHVRLGDGWFVDIAEENARLVWWRLVHEVLGFSIDDTLDIETRVYDTDRGYQVPRPARGFHPINETLPSTFPHARLQCRGQRHTSARLQALNTPLYLATDAKDPINEPMLTLFLRTFPCIYFLDDFAESLKALDGLVNEYDGIKLKHFLVPFVDAMVAANAWRTVGTESSTFSRFMEDVLWPSYHGKGIVERG